MAKLPRIETERLILRLPEDRDAVPILSFYVENRSFLSPWYPDWPPDFFTLGFWKRRVRGIRDEFARDQCLRFYLFEKSGGSVVGSIAFSQIHRGAAQYAVLGYSLSQSAEGKGLMFEALQAAIRFAFKELKLHRIMANYMPSNERSGRLLERLGFTVEGRARDYLLIAGKWEDHILTSLLNPEWGPPTSAF